MMPVNIFMVCSFFQFIVSSDYSLWTLAVKKVAPYRTIVVVMIKMY